MCPSLPTYPSSSCRHDGGFVAVDHGLGELFRQYGERYIRAYHPDQTRIKLIRSIRVCRTPALGGKVYTCRSCRHQKYVYYSCGNSRCPKCQGIKRMQWQDKLGSKLLNCPYQHIVFTLPHRLNRLARDNPTAIYNVLLRSAWSSLKQCALERAHLGATPGAIMVLHTFGSDLKYHVHVHALVTFGGLDDQQTWQWPKRKRKIVPFRAIRNTFRSHFLKQLSKIYEDLQRRESIDDLLCDLLSKAWCVHAEPPTANVDRIKEYLARYICRIGLSKTRFRYDRESDQVRILFKDYRHKDKETGTVPMEIKKLEPLVALHHILQHCLPAYFQKCRLLWFTCQCVL